MKAPFRTVMTSITACKAAIALRKLRQKIDDALRFLEPNPQWHWTELEHLCFQNAVFVGEGLISCPGLFKNQALKERVKLAAGKQSSPYVRGALFDACDWPACGDQEGKKFAEKHHNLWQEKNGVSLETFLDGLKAVMAGNEPPDFRPITIRESRVENPRQEL